MKCAHYEAKINMNVFIRKVLFKKMYEKIINREVLKRA